MKHTHVTYGPGGFDPSTPGGNVLHSEEVDLPDPEPDPVQARLDALTDAVDTLILDSLGGL